jgi:hypothetical protein
VSARRGLAAVVVAIVAAVAGALVAAALAPASAPAVTAAGAPACNGEVQLCDRSLGEVAFATTHNSMAASANGFVPPNQRRGLQAQLEHGIRALQIDAYFGTPRGGRVYTDLSGPLGQAAELPRGAVRGAELLHRRLGAPPAGTAYDVYLCHVFCEIGAVRMLDEMQVVREFLDTHPREVLVVVIEDYVPPDAVSQVLREAGLESELLAVDPAAPLPTLGQMIDAGTRLQVSLENGAAPPTLPNAFTGLVEETPFTFARPRGLERPASCADNRGTSDAPIFQFNHWVTPAEPFTARQVNSAILRRRLAECTERRGRGPTLVAVDFAEQGDLLRVVERLNR